MGLEPVLLPEPLIKGPVQVGAGGRWKGLPLGLSQRHREQPQLPRPQPCSRALQCWGADAPLQAGTLRPGSAPQLVV